METASWEVTSATVWRDLRVMVATEATVGIVAAALGKEIESVPALLGAKQTPRTFVATLGKYPFSNY